MTPKSRFIISAKNKKSVYDQETIILTTKHYKSLAVKEVFKKKLNALVNECSLDTDTLGMFSGEIERKMSSLECARLKCQMGLDFLGAEYGLANEGSFGPYLPMPLMPADYEILYFIDRKNNFSLHLSEISLKTNYKNAVVKTFEKLQIFAQQALYPSHSLIIRPHKSENEMIYFKGINTDEALRTAFYESIALSIDHSVWVETDMRAHMNPSRMKVIEALAIKLAERLKTHCPECQAPGWGKVDSIKGLLCSWCSEPTDFIKNDVFGCTKCEYREYLERQDGLKSVEPQHCNFCNP